MVDDGGMWAWLLLDPKDYVVLENFDLKLNGFLLWIDEVEHRGLLK